MSASVVGQLKCVEGLVNSQKYQEILQQQVLESIEVLNLNGKYISQQDGASCHTVRATKLWFARNT